MRTEAINLSLERTISRARLSKYLDVTDNNLDEALSLYERNIRLSEALYTTFQGLEVCLRNSINHELRTRYGDDWMENVTTPLDGAAIDQIQKAIQELNNPSHDAVVAELKFSFWVGLLGPRYDQSLWRSALYKGFAGTSGKKRRDVHRRMNALRRFRNRVAHHEPIYDRAQQMHAEALEAIEWMCRDTHAWVAACSKFEDVYNTQP